MSKEDDVIAGPAWLLEAENDPLQTSLFEGELARDRRKGPPAGDLVHGPVGRPDTGHRPHCRWRWSECTCWSEVGVPLPDPDTSLH